VKEDKIRVLILGCGARGKDTYTKQICTKLSDVAEIVGAIDLDSKKLEEMQKEYGVPKEVCYTDADKILDGEKIADIVFICTLDKLHYSYAIKAMKKGYHILLEKPISPDLKECIEIERVAKEYNRKVVVCHVLRYTPFYREIKRWINKGVVGDIVSMQAIEMVGYWHQAHSFVRGNWCNKEETSPMILQKCCHDFDILLWLCGKKSKRVSSFGDLRLFKRENMPENATERCTDGCPHSETCPYFAPRYYLTQVRGGNTGWPINLLNPHPTEEIVLQALKDGPYGICVYRCNNNVVDHQVVNIQLEDGSTIDFTMCAFTKQSYRKLRIMGTMGEIEGDMETNRIIVKPFVGDTIDINVNELSDDFSGHGGGDIQMLREMIDLVKNGDSLDKEGLTLVEQSMQSHYVAFAAEESRINNGKVIDISEFIK